MNGVKDGKPVPTGNPRVSVRGLTKRFGEVTAVNDVSFEIAENEFFSLLGPSGCGKTTTLRCVAGLETADEGEIRIGDDVVYSSSQGINRPANERDIGMVFQNYAVWPHMTVFDNIAYPLKVRGVPQREIRERVGQVLEMLAMGHLGSRMPSQLSGGQQQRVALGRALVVNPQVLLLDEPLSNLDAKLRELMRVELARIQRETGIPILYVTHDQVEALAMSDRIAVMSGGVIHQLASPTEIYQRPATQFVLDFIGTVNYIACRLVDAEEKTVRLEGPNGQPIVIPRPPYVPEGEGVLLAVRPEDIAIVRDEGARTDAEAAGRQGAALGVPGLEARVELQSFLGNLCEYRVQAGDVSLRVQTDKKVQIREGAKVRLVIREGLLLDADALERPTARAS